MFKMRKGWTKERMKRYIMRGNTGKRSMAPGPGAVCRYRGVDGNKCAVGCFIPDGKYEDAMDLVGPVSELLEEFPFVDKMLPLSLKGMDAMQTAHDIVPKDEHGVDKPHADVRVALCEWIDKNVR